MRVSKIEVSPAELLLADVRAGKTLSSTPFGYDGGSYYTKNPVPWKGVRGKAFWDLLTTLPRGAGLEKGLRTAIGISQRHHEYGVSLVERIDGAYLIVPAKCAGMMADAGTLKRVVATAPTALALMMRAYALGMMPRAYTPTV
jgi:hypothetical protein